MAVYQISRIQHRRGTSGELPDALADGEIGMTTDTGEVFIGAPDHPMVSGRKSYPYQNIKILTELDVQRGIKGDVYYHGALTGARVNSGVTASCVPLFAHGSRDFATYEVSVSTLDRTRKAMFVLTVCVHPSIPGSSTVHIIPGSYSFMPAATWTASLLAGNDVGGTPAFTLSALDDQGLNSGVTWLSFHNQLGADVIISVAGREWSNASV